MRFIILSMPQSGNTLLERLLSSHHQIRCMGELLRPDNATHFQDGPLTYISAQLEHPENSVGLTVFPHHLQDTGTTLCQLARHIQADSIIVLWRENVADALISLTPVPSKDNGHSVQPPATTHTRPFSKDDIVSHKSQLEDAWEAVFEFWPTELPPTTVRYENLIEKPTEVVNGVFKAMGLATMEELGVCTSLQNTRMSIENGEDRSSLSTEIRSLSICPPMLLRKTLVRKLNLPDEDVYLFCEPEPPRPADGWAVRVSEPFMPPSCKTFVMEALDSCSISSAGKWPAMLSNKLKQRFGVPVAQPTCNGTMALQLALQVVGLEPGDEVVLPTLTIVAVSNAVRLAGGVPVFADCAKNSYNPEYEEIIKNLTSRTRAVIVAPLFGVPLRTLEAIATECRQRNITLIEDISECIGVTVLTQDGQRKQLGTFGDFACSSLYANKLIHGGDAGFILAKDPACSSRLASMANHGLTRSYRWLQHELSGNAKINGLGAAVAFACLNDIDSALRHRTELATIYRTELETVPLELMPTAGTDDTPWLFGITCRSQQERNRLRSFLGDCSIETRLYFHPLHLQPTNAAFRIEGHTFENANDIYARGLNLPTYFDLKPDKARFVTDAVKRFFREERPLPTPAQYRPENVARTSVHLSDIGEVVVSMYDQNGRLVSDIQREQVVRKATILGIQANSLLVSEARDACKSLVDGYRKLRLLEIHPQISDYVLKLKPYMEYFELVAGQEAPVPSPVLRDTDWEEFKAEASCIPTATEDEVYQLLISVIQQHGISRVLQIGGWLGHSARLMAKAISLYGDGNPEMTVIDTFRWSSWMNKFAPNDRRAGESFLDEFLENLGPHQQIVSCVETNMVESNAHIPDINPQLVFLDFTKEQSEMETAWRKLRSKIGDGTLLVFNNMNARMLPFFVNHKNELDPIYKPEADAKAYRFLSGQPSQIPGMTFSNGF